MQFCHFPLSFGPITRAYAYFFKDTRTQEKKHAKLIFFVKCLHMSNICSNFAPAFEERWQSGLLRRS